MGPDGFKCSCGLSRDGLADWEHGSLPLPSITRVFHCIELAQEKIKIQSMASTDCVSLSHHCKVKKKKKKKTFKV